MLRGIARTLTAVICVAALAQQSNLGSLFFGDECRDGCPDSDASHRCPLNCTACTCVGHGTPVGLALPTLPLIRHTVVRTKCDEPLRLLDPQLDPPFHVPRPILV
jgi:hypothetical protein